MTPRAFYVLRDGSVVVARSPACDELFEGHPIEKTVDSEGVERPVRMIDMGPRLLSRRERRAALRKAGAKWPAGGTAFIRHAYQ